MHAGHAFHKALLKIRIRRFSRTTDPQTRAKLQLALDSQELLDDCCEAVCGYYDDCCATATGPLADFLDWLVKNWPAILEIILKLIDVFSGS